MLSSLLSYFYSRWLFALFLCCFFSLSFSSPPDRKSKILHLTFHRGCAQEMMEVAEALSLDLDTWFIPDLSPEFWDPFTKRRESLYNMGHERAERIWNELQEIFNSYDAIMTSDTAPLARIFLQNGYSKRLIVWICNRFDYADVNSLDCSFPDPEFYQLFAAGCCKKNVVVVNYTLFEHHYALSKGVDTGGLVITPCAPLLHPQQERPNHSPIPSEVRKEECFFIPPYHNENHFMDLSAHLTALGIPHYRGRYAGSLDLADFKGIVHLPYNWSNLALFENLALGIPYFIPSIRFFKELASQGNYFHGNLDQLLQKELFHLSEWYCEEHASLLTYFDSWEDLQYKLKTADYAALRERMLSHSAAYRLKMMLRWKEIFDQVDCL